jgi:rfaE bifunctional protein nucleotidyltransferase chain/domain
LSRIDHWAATNSKIIGLQEAVELSVAWKKTGQKIVFTNGCFDILHLGHVTYLAKAASLGDRLIVALNTDESVRKLNKAPNRPIHDEKARQIVIAALSYVDGVLLFNEHTPLSTIQALLPDVLVKGADYNAEETNKAALNYIVGSDIVRKNGGEIKTIELVSGHSTTTILSK